MKILLVYAPFCTPASPPYSITNIRAFLSDNLSSEYETSVLDLNIKFHKTKFDSYYDYFKNLKHDYEYSEYDEVVGNYSEETAKVYSENNKLVVNGQKPELFDEMLQHILDAKPDVVGFSLVFSSQVFYAKVLIEALKEKGIRCVIGGPAVNEKIRTIADACHNNVIEFLGWILGKKFKTPEEYNALNYDTAPDFSIYDLEEYFTPEPVIPIRASSSCYYRQCAFCTHHRGGHYFEYDLDNVEKIVQKSGAKNIFFVDDMIHKKRLLDIAKFLKPYDVKWMCQLSPSADLDKDTLKILSDSGLSYVLWGVESGNDRIIKLMRKGTNVHDITQVLTDAKSVGIRNGVFTMFGFPTETEDEFIDTINFLKKNSDNIDIVSTSVFGLQQGSYIFDHPEEFDVYDIELEERTVLDPKVSYKCKSGLSASQVNKLRKRYQGEIEKINKYPRNMNYFREHMLVLD